MNRNPSINAGINFLLFLFFCFSSWVNYVFNPQSLDSYPWDSVYKWNQVVGFGVRIWGWSPNIQRGLTYDTNEQCGAELWESVQAKITRNTSTNAAVENKDSEQYGKEYLTHAKLGQGAFRILVTDAYHRRCAVTNEKTLPVLEAAHIRSYSKNGPHRTNNGLLLRADIHRLFDDGYVTLDSDLHFLVSERVRVQFENGREYYRFHGVKLQNLPDSVNDLPSREFIRWHNEECFERI